MYKNTHGGYFIVFEGLDGSGSSTQAELLGKSLTNNGYKVLVTKEPTNNLIGGLIRGQLTHEWSSNMETLQLLFAADRAHHLEKTVIPALTNKWVVISDRYFFSTLAFGALDIDMAWLQSLNERFLLPDCTLYLQVPSKDVIARMRATRDKFELFEEEKKLAKVKNNYMQLAKDFANIHTINGTNTIPQISGEIDLIIRNKIHKRDIARAGGLI
ncbi:dTMP kinase [Candidatus Berkelbacteria bacterium CG06_land_8_20_14_3_00_43_10]|uniref:Thymidylate kinase n=1 Tax=Candidatus Berkelbacteria bacterium CG10_big_fil_rev_8_21_14_0_10_43_14 TaxID=1974515 RepID=A0A2M6R8U6_9BACT|nr:MAG: dTMP kinase [Candidatus Berkelbacteria bacterium CG2_30_43_20]PIS06953.1 MAG: dTMP kinase [Candidatus Berkelbacteria bacterium CG10_big_fil_rev_8_21_14_0_10_43_14]PIU87024.1 MAG: dTMP kinase [Candidatus Berkelbacteria bacterium CG06_land_8_20_14_3_00_43_10]